MTPTQPKEPGMHGIGPSDLPGDSADNRLKRDLPVILERLGSSVGMWQERLEKLHFRGRSCKMDFAKCRSVINGMTEVRGVKMLNSMTDCSG